jgi:hypothetical protein
MDETQGLLETPEPCEACVTCKCTDAWSEASRCDEDGCCSGCGGVSAAVIVHAMGRVPHPPVACPLAEPAKEG